MTSQENKKSIYLVHCYWFDYGSENLLDAHGKLQLLATENILKEGVEKVVLLGGTIDPKNPPVGQIMYNQLSKRLSNKLLSKVLVAPNSLTTRQEVKAFLKLTSKNNWQRIASLGINKQQPRVKRAFKRFHRKNYDLVRFVTTEEILSKYGYHKELSSYSKSTAAKSIAVNEFFVNVVDSIPIVGGGLIDFLIKLFPKKGVLLSKIYSGTK